MGQYIARQPLMHKGKIVEAGAVIDLHDTHAGPLGSAVIAVAEPAPTTPPAPAPEPLQGEPHAPIPKAPAPTPVSTTPRPAHRK